MTFAPRKYRRDKEPGEGSPMPVVSVVSWEVHEAICEPYTIKAVVSASAAISRKQVLGQLARFSIQPDDEREKREFSGFVTQFDSLTESRDGYTWRVVVRQRLAMLDGPSNCATYQQMASWEIIGEVLKRHDIRHWMQVEFRLRREHPKHAFRFQYNIGDWSYIRLEMEQAGLFCYTAPGQHGEVLVIADDVDGYLLPRLSVPSRPSSGLSTFEESLFSFKVSTRTVPEAFVVADYNPENAWERWREESSVAPDDDTMVGTPYVWGTHHADAAGAKREARLRHESARAHQVRYKAKSTVLDIRPGRVVETDRELEDTRWGMFVTKVVHRGSRSDSYMNSFRAIPADRPYRMAIDESRWPRVHGTLGATICSPDKYKYAYLSANGEYIARFHCDFGNWPKGGESVPLRLAKPFAGRDHTGMHLPALDGDEAVVAFRGGDPNRPYIAGFHHNSQSPDLINSSRRRMSRNEIRTQSGNKLWMEDWDQQQGVELSTEHSGRSQLNLGFIPDRELNARGAGAELRTSAHLVGRGGAGVMLTAYNQPGGDGKVLDTTEARAQLDEHAALADALAQSAEASKASPADVRAQKAISADLDEVRKPGVLVTGPGPVGIVSGDGVQVAADGSIIATAKKGVHVSTLKRFTVAAGGVASMFAQKGLKLIAAAGDIVMQAQRGRMQIASQEDLTVESVDGVMHLKSRKEIILNVDGTYLRLGPDGVEIGTRGGVQFRSSRLSKTGPAQMDLGGAAFAPVFVPFTTDCEVWRSKVDFTEGVAAGAGGDAGNEGVAAPSPIGNFISSAFDNNPLKIDDSANAPNKKSGLKEYPQPVQLKSAVPCNWKMAKFDRSVRLSSETAPYYLHDRDGALVKRNNSLQWCSTEFHSSCRFIYDPERKILTAKVAVALVPKLLISIDPKTKKELRNKNGDYVVVNYDSFNNGANSGRPFESWNIKIIDRDIKSVDISTYKDEIEETLNKDNYKLLLDGCNKGAACGCRVSIKFNVDIHVVNEADAATINADKVIILFPTVDRADAAHWGEQNYKINSANKTVKVNNQVRAHEIGHLFNFPDEYYKGGGFIHKQYIKADGHLDFELGKRNTSEKVDAVWQLESSENLMGYGSNNETAATRPYYVEYIRRWFSEYTNKEWRVGA